MIWYSVAYQTEGGKDFDHNIPYVNNLANTPNSVRKLAQEIKDKGYKNVTIFSCDSSEYPELVDWDFVREHEFK
jgi:hypothetical protein